MTLSKVRSLHLVHGAAQRTPGRVDGLVVQTTARWQLVGTRREPDTVVRASAWHTFLAGLWPHEEVVIEHRFGHATAPGQSDYSMTICLRQGLAGRASQSRQVMAQALAGALPRWRLDALPLPAVEPPAMPLRARLVPAAVRLTAVRRLGEGPWVRPALYPGELPAWSLTTPFEEPLAEPGGYSLHIRLWRAPGDAATTERNHRLLQDLRRGALRVQHPDAAAEPALHDVELDARLQTLLAEWLRAPDIGYCVEVGVRSEAPMSAYALHRLARDLFGAFPVQIHGPEDTPIEYWPLLPKQGLGGFFPSDACLRRAGVRAIETQPRQLPAQPGPLIGLAGEGAPVHLPEAHRTSHTVVLGSSGCGKSSLLCRMLGEDMAAGHGVGLIDPHGDLFDLVLNAVPACRQNDVVVVDVEDPDFSVALNPMEGTLDDLRLRNFVCNQICSLVDRLFEGDDTSGPVTRNHVRHALLLAMCHPEGGTLADAPRIFLDDGFRDWLLAKADARLRDYFEHFARTSGDHGYGTWRPYVLARFERFITNPAMRALLCRPSTASLRELMDRGAIVLMRLSKSVLEQAECQIVGTLLLMQYHAAAMARAGCRPQDRRPFHLVVDEFHSFASPAVPAMFRECRKYGLSLTVATQSLGSLRHARGGDLVNAVLANSATKLLFRLSPTEANLVDEYTLPQFTARDVTRLPNYRAVMSLAAAGLEPFALDTLLPEAPNEAADAVAVRAASNSKWATPTAQVATYLERRHEQAPSKG
jgi:hypothetical protein